MQWRRDLEHGPKCSTQGRMTEKRMSGERRRRCYTVGVCRIYSRNSDAETNLCAPRGFYFNGSLYHWRLLPFDFCQACAFSVGCSLKLWNNLVVNLWFRDALDVVYRKMSPKRQQCKGLVIDLLNGTYEH